MNDESWLVGLLNKRPLDSIRVLLDLVGAGLARGECSANDVASYVSEPNTIGCAFRVLKRYGFIQSDRRIKPVDKCKHGRPLYVWELKDRNQAEVFLAALRRVLVVREPSEGGSQLLMRT